MILNNLAIFLIDLYMLWNKILSGLNISNYKSLTFFSEKVSLPPSNEVVRVQKKDGGHKLGLIRTTGIF